jgi:hypothetical protein
MIAQDFRGQNVVVGDKVIATTGYSGNTILGEFEVVGIKRLMKPFRGYQIGTVLLELKGTPTINNSGVMIAFHEQNVFRYEKQVVKA